MWMKLLFLILLFVITCSHPLTFGDVQNNDVKKFSHNYWSPEERKSLLSEQTLKVFGLDLTYIPTIKDDIINSNVNQSFRGIDYLTTTSVQYHGKKRPKRKSRRKLYDKYGWGMNIGKYD